MPSNQLSLPQRVLFACTIFLSAFLLFSIEPLTAKRILPWFGGSAAVWSTCLVFYQTALLLGYAYAMLLARALPPLWGSLCHIGLLAVSLLLLPVGPASGGSAATGEPSIAILLLLTASIGLPFVALSATSPLLQHWLSRGGYQTPYRLFALSNVASLLALLSYPFLIEPALDTTAQARLWSLLFALFAAACALAAWLGRKATLPETPAFGAKIWILPTRIATWFALSTCGSMLLLSVTNHMDENVAAVPLLWVVPLTVYLLTFVFTFGAEKHLPRALWLRLLAFALGILGYSIYNVSAVEALQVSIPILLIGLFICCMFCHGELNRLRPDTGNLTLFYLVIAAGGAAGAILVGLVAPVIFRGVYELPVTLTLTAILALITTWEEGGLPLRLLWAGVTVSMLVVVGANVRAYRESTVALNRSFYGSLRVLQTPRAGPEGKRTLLHGTIEHGEQYLNLPNRLRPSTYYGPDSGIGILLREGFTRPKRVGVVGLGTGTVAAYGMPGDTFRFYELNSQVTDIAQSLFTYLRESKANVSVIPGDARLSLAGERDQPRFDVLVLDAFSGDAIPVHLLTREAITLYQGRLTANGILAVNVSNNYLDLAPVVQQLASSVGWGSVLVRNHEDADSGLLAADWVLVSADRDILNNPSIRTHSLAISKRPGLRPWTDSYNNLLQIIKIPDLHR